MPDIATGFTYQTLPSYPTPNTYSLDVSIGTFYENNMIGSPQSLVFHPNGKFAFMCHKFGYGGIYSGTIATWSVNKATGELTYIRTLNININSTQLYCKNAAIDATGQYLYVRVNNVQSSYASDQLNSRICTLSINQTTGELSLFSYTNIIADNLSNPFAVYGISLIYTGANKTTAALMCSIANNPMTTVGSIIFPVNNGVVTLTTSSNMYHFANVNGWKIDPTQRNAWMVSYSLSSPFLDNVTLTDTGQSVDYYSIYDTSVNITSGCMIDIAFDPLGRFMYATTSLNTIRTYTVNENVVDLSSFSTVTSTSPSNIIADPTGKYVFALNSVEQTLLGYRVNPTTGALTALTGFPITLTNYGLYINQITMDPSGSFIYAYLGESNILIVININQIDTINSPAGAIIPSESQSITITTGQLQQYNRWSSAMDPFGRFAYTTWKTAAGDNTKYLNVYIIDKTTGIFTLNQTITLPQPQGYIYTHANGRFLYFVGDTNAAPSLRNSTIYTYVINETTGQLTLQANTATIAGANSSPFQGSFKNYSGGRYMIAVNWSANTLYAYSVDSTTGVLTYVTSYTTTTNGWSMSSYSSDASERNFVFGAYYYFFDTATNIRMIAFSNGTFSDMSITQPAMGLINVGFAIHDVCIDSTERFMWVSYRDASNIPKIQAYKNTDLTFTISGTATNSSYFSAFTTASYTGFQHLIPNNNFLYGFIYTGTNVGVSTSGGNATLKSGGYVMVWSVNQSTGVVTVFKVLRLKAFINQSTYWFQPYINYMSKTFCYCYASQASGGTAPQTWAIHKLVQAPAFGTTAGAPVINFSARSSLAPAYYSPPSIIYHPNKKFAFFHQHQQNFITIYKLDQSGYLSTDERLGYSTNWLGAPYYNSFVFMHPSGKFIFSNNGTQIVNTSGEFTDVVSGSVPVSGINAGCASLDKNGKFLYVSTGIDSFQVFKINQTTGVLSHVPNSPYTVPTANGRYINQIIPDKSGKFIFVLEGGGGVGGAYIHTYSINGPNGDLTFVNSLSIATIPNQGTIDQTNRFLYTADNIQTGVQVYSINQITGIVSFLSTTTTTIPVYTSFVCDVSGKFIYAGLYNTGTGAATLQSWSINQSTGALTSAGTVAIGVDIPISISVDPYEGKNIHCYSQITTSATGALYGVTSTPGITRPQLPSLLTSRTGNFPEVITIHPTGYFAYILNTCSETITNYKINQSDGTLSEQSSVATGFTPMDITVDPTGKFGYVVNRGESSVKSYSINQTTGEFTATGSASTGMCPHGIACDRTGAFAYVVNNAENNVQKYTINQTTGILSAGSTISTGFGPTLIINNPVLNAIYVLNVPERTISSYSINISTGDLTLLGTIPTGAYPQDITCDPLGKFVAVANYGSNTIQSYYVNQNNGNLSYGSTVSTAASANPCSVAFNSTGKILYASNTSAGTLQSFYVESSGRFSSLGTITSSLSGTSYPRPYKIAAHPTITKYIYILHLDSNIVSLQYGVDANSYYGLSSDSSYTKKIHTKKQLPHDVKERITDPIKRNPVYWGN